MIETPIPTGVYQHYKGRYYLVLGEATHSETNAQLVVYQPLYGTTRWFVRPKTMFLEMVETASGREPRFAFVGEEAP